MMELVLLTVGDQPEIVPSSVAKMNADDPVSPPAVTLKPPPPLYTWPVGAAVPGVWPGGVAMVTCGTVPPNSDCFTPWPL